MSPFGYIKDIHAQQSMPCYVIYSQMLVFLFVSSFFLCFVFIV